MSYPHFLSNRPGCAEEKSAARCPQDQDGRAKSQAGSQGGLRWATPARSCAPSPFWAGWAQIAGIGAFSAFTSQTDNQGNNVTAGTVAISDNDGGTALYTITNAKPSSAQTSCIKVTYTGSLDSDVKLYTPSSLGALGPQVNLKIEPGTQATPSFPSCTGFVADSGGAIFDAALSTFPTTYASGVSDNPGTVATKWVTNDAVVYRVTATVSASAPDSAQGQTTGAHTVRWEAHNQ